MPSSEQANAASLYFNADTGVTEQHIFFVGTDGSLNQSWWDTYSWNSQVLPGSPASDPVAMPWYANLAPELHVFFRDVDGNLGHTFWGPVNIDGGNGWATDTIPGSPVGNVAAAFYDRIRNVSEPEMHIFYIESDGTLHQTWLAPGGFIAQALPGSPTSPSSPLCGVSALDFQNQQEGQVVSEQHVFYVEQNGTLGQTWWDSNQWIFQPLPGTPGGLPAAIVCDNGENLQHVMFVAGHEPQDWSLQQSWWDGTQWNNQTLPGQSLGPSLLAAAFTNPANVIEQHAFYVGLNGGLEQSWWDGTQWNNQPLPGRPSRLLGVGNYYPQNGPTEQHVFFRADDGSLQQSWWDGTQWNNQDLPAAAPVRG